MRGLFPETKSLRLATFAVLGFQILGSCDRVRGYDGQCCPAELIDSGKLLQPNLPGSTPGEMTFTLDYGKAPSFDLTRLLRRDNDRVIWSVNSVAIGDSILQLRKVPKADGAIVYRIGVHRLGEERSDVFSVIVLAAGTRQLFSSWYESERNDMAWLSLLPPVYSTLGPGMSDPEPKNCATRYWEGVHALDSRFHPGGTYEMRSRPVEGHGHQAVYDSSGHLIATGPGAGSADKGAPMIWKFGLIKHRDRDVRPYVWAAQLDGNPVNATWVFRDLDVPLVREGEHIRQYQSVRPALWGQSPEIAAGACILVAR